jgi:hypothetical protein
MISQVRKAILNMINAAMRDPKMKTLVVYRKFASTDPFDRAKGYLEVDFDESVIDSIKMKHDARSINFSGDNSLQVGQPVFIFKWEDLPAGVSLKDQIQENGHVYKVKLIQPVFETVALITCEAG